MLNFNFILLKNFIPFTLIQRLEILFILDFFLYLGVHFQLAIRDFYFALNSSSYLKFLYCLANLNFNRINLSFTNFICWY